MGKRTGRWVFVPAIMLLVAQVPLPVCASDLLSFRPAGSVEELYRLEFLPVLRPGVRCRMFSSYDRSGGNDDGFNGSYSKLRIEDGDSVIAEMSGPGCIQRIWFTHSSFRRDGLLGREGEHIRVYVDGNESPALDVPLEELFSGRLAQFPRPLAGRGLGGFYCYVPIPYRTGCKVLVDGDSVRFYHITYSEFADAGGVESFSMALTPEKAALLERAVAAWSSLGDLSLLGARSPECSSHVVDLQPGESAAIRLPAGPRMVRGVFLDLASRAEPPSGRVNCTWDGARPFAVDVPIGLFFGHTPGAMAYRSLLCGRVGTEFYNFFPMPYRESGRITVTAEESFAGTVRVLTESLSQWGGSLGYFHAVYQEALPTGQHGVHFPWLRCKGTGHYAGTFLVTGGRKGPPNWLEGDERFLSDGDLAIHGTGTEDYFNCGWYGIKKRLDRPGAFPLHGFPVYGRSGVAPACDLNRFRAAAYRWHVVDPVPFARSLVAEIEHGPHNRSSAAYRSAAFYYAADPAGP